MDRIRGTGMSMEIEKTEAIYKDNSQNVQIRRVGTVTFGLTLICFGIMFLIHIVVPALRYDIIFRLWPLVFILLGSEILVENHKSGRAEYKFVYDFAAVIMLALVLFFAMMMAIVDYALTHGGIYL